MKVKATKMTDADVEYLSLVESGANWAPIKVLKSEKGGRPMIAMKGELFSEVFKTDNPEVTPAVLAVMVTEGSDLDAAKGCIEKAGLSIEEPKKVKGGTVFMQKAAQEVPEGANRAVVRLSDGLAAICTLEKAFEPWPGSSSFTENLNSMGFYPGLDIALEAFRETARGVARKAESPSDMASGLRQASEEFSTHISSMTQMLPAEVFKLEDAAQEAPKEKQTTVTVTVEQLLAGASAAARQPGEGTEGLQPDPAQAEGGEEIAARPVMNKQDEGGVHDLTPAEQAAEDAAKKKKPAKPGAKPGAPAATAKEEGAEGEAGAEGAEGGEAAAAAEEDPTAKALGTLVEKIDGLTTELGELGKRVEKAEETAQAADEAINGTVHAEPEGDNVQKGEESAAGDPPLIDTGFESIEGWEENAAA